MIFETASRHRLPILFGGIVLSLGTLIIASLSVHQVSHPKVLGNAIIFDLLITIPLVYFLVIRKTTIPVGTTVPVFVLGYVLVLQLLPIDNYGWLSAVGTYLIPLIELVFVGYFIVTIRKIGRNVKKAGHSEDLPEALLKAIDTYLPNRMSAFLTYECCLLYYGLFCWRPRPLRKKEFSYHKQSGVAIIFVFVLFLVLVESVVVHLLIVQYSVIIAWIFTGLSWYSCLIVLGISKSKAYLPTRVHNYGVTIRYGLFAKVEIPFKSIADVQLSKMSSEKIKALSPLGALEDSNVVIRLHHPYEKIGLYGFKTTVDHFAFYLDEPEEFVSETNKYLQ